MANDRAHELMFPWASPPERATTLDVAPGVKWLRMGLPFALDHTNLWLLRDRFDDGSGRGLREGWTIVDCGIANDATRQAWQSIFDTQLEGLPVLRVIVTHMHPDHMGLAHWLCEHWQCRLWISATDFNAARIAVQPNASFGGEDAARFVHSHGITDPTMLDQIRQRSTYFSSMVPAVPAQFRRLQDGDVIRIGHHDWHCVAGYGHAPEHIALHGPSLGLLISGDMVLPRISTNVMVIHLEPEANPLSLYLQSLQRYLPMPADTLVLPSHGLPFRGLHSRVQQLIDHHDERFDLVLRTCRDKPSTAAELLPLLFRRALDLHQTTFAIGEAIAHLHALWFRGQLRLTMDAAGVRRFEAVA